MKFTKYLKDKIIEITFSIFIYFLILLLLLAFKSKIELIISLTIIYFIPFIFITTKNFYKKQQFINTLLNNINNLDKAYLVLETLKKPSSYEDQLIYDAMYEINKSMNENIKNYKEQVDTFKNYIEMWIHEVKIPLSSLTLLVHNHKDKFSKNSLKQIKKIDDYLEQILYYVRSENANKDYLINKVNLKKSITAVALKNKDFILESNINLIVENIQQEIYTDSKWLEFIINQIISNSIKYKDNNKESFIKIYTIENKETVSIVIEDNGIGISKSDIRRVFEKSFTGENGRINGSSTGMGLFIVKNLCDKLGHSIKIDSEKNQYTKVYITVSKNKYYEVVK